MNLSKFKTKKEYTESFRSKLDFLDNEDKKLLLNIINTNWSSHFEITRILNAKEGDHYSVLGLNYDSTLKDIEERYLELLPLVHPYKTKIVGSQDAIVKLQHAYYSLNSEEKKFSYDTKTRQYLHPSVPTGYVTATSYRSFNFFELFNGFSLLRTNNIQQSGFNWQFLFNSERNLSDSFTNLERIVDLLIDRNNLFNRRNFIGRSGTNTTRASLIKYFFIMIFLFLSVKIASMF
ncbi:hypothetical protein A0H76_1320 [Hepatospora eriocheir]|uniref:J domain-containing protein n=1 Tax=Hepatospora eriocheir TaxID=1081669 RepID=A0A1X0QH96_9MICR|nr:hypothetical protein A0H76_1320 [Hepatospora eriocheir]